MEIINKSSNGITSRVQSYKGICVSIVKCAKGYVSLSKELCETFDIVEGEKISFVADIDRLYFFKDQDNGFLLRKNGSSLRVYNHSLVERLVKSVPLLRNKFIKIPVRKSNTKINESEAFEILVDKRL